MGCEGKGGGGRCVIPSPSGRGGGCGWPHGQTPSPFLPTQQWGRARAPRLRGPEGCGAGEMNWRWREVGGRDVPLAMASTVTFQSEILGPWATSIDRGARQERGEGRCGCNRRRGEGGSWDEGCGLWGEPPLGRGAHSPVRILSTGVFVLSTGPGTKGGELWGCVG